MEWIGKFKTTKIGGWCSKFEVTGGRRHCVKITTWCYFLFVLLKGMAKRQWQLVIAFWPKLSTAFSRIEWSKSWLTQEEARKAKNVVLSVVVCCVRFWFDVIHMCPFVTCLWLQMLLFSRFLRHGGQVQKQKWKTTKAKGSEFIKNEWRKH